MKYIKKINFNFEEIRTLGNNRALYVIKNKTTGRYYVGKSKKVRQRAWHHLNDLLKNQHHSVFLQRSWNKYGEKDFVFSIIEVPKNASHAVKREQFYLNKQNRNKMFNVCWVSGSCEGTKYSAERKKRHSEAMKKRVISAEHRRLMTLGRQRTGITKKHQKLLNYISSLRAFKLTDKQCRDAVRRQSHGETLHSIAESFDSCDKPFRRELRKYLRKNKIKLKIIYKNGGEVGEEHPLSLLTTKDAIQIKKSRKPLRFLESKFGVSYTCIWDIKNGRSWAHI